MGYPPLEDLLPKSGYSIYKLVRLASKRATELADGRKTFVDLGPDAKTTTLALEEIKAGMVVLKDVAGEFEPSEEKKEEEKQEEELAEAQEA